MPSVFGFLRGFFEFFWDSIEFQDSFVILSTSPSRSHQIWRLFVLNRSLVVDYSPFDSSSIRGPYTHVIGTSKIQHVTNMTVKYPMNSMPFSSSSPSSSWHRSPLLNIFHYLQQTPCHIFKQRLYAHTHTCVCQCVSVSVCLRLLFLRFFLKKFRFRFQLLLYVCLTWFDLILVVHCQFFVQLTTLSPSSFDFWPPSSSPMRVC